MKNSINLSLSAIFFVFGFVGYYYFSELATVLRVLLVLLGVVLSVVVAYFTEEGRQFARYAREAVDETRKVVWPEKAVTMQTTGVVFLFVLLMAIFLWLSDKFLVWVLYTNLLGWYKG